MSKTDVVKKIQSKTINPYIETRELESFISEEKNIYEVLNVISKRSNQISQHIKEELHQKLKDFASMSDSLDEVSEDLDTIEISRFYERLPHSTIVATKEFLDGEIYYRNPKNEESNED